MQKSLVLEQPPDEGVYIRGLFMEGARWNMEEYCIDESHPKILYDEFPPVRIPYSWLLVYIIYCALSTDCNNYDKEFQIDVSRVRMVASYPHVTNFLFSVLNIYIIFAVLNIIIRLCVVFN